MLALTATDTSEIFAVVKRRLCLEHPSLVGVSPSRDNIKYYVEPLQSINKLCELMSANLVTSCTGFPKTLTFCQTIAECASMHRTLRRMLGDHFT